jgi:hypothetical protein
MIRLAGCLVCVSVLVACGGDPDGGDSFGGATAPTTNQPTTNSTDGDDDGTSAGSATTDGTASVGPTSTDSADATSGTTAVADSTSAADDSPNFDVGAGTGTTGEMAPCVKVDVILAVDASSSMDGVIEDLQAAFNGWVGSLLNDVGDGGIMDFQLAVIDGCDLSPFFHDTNDASGACNFSTGGNYMISSSPSLGAEFACVSNTQQSNYSVGDLCTGDEDDESPARAAANAVTFPAESNENAGFLRDDAVLFVVAVTNEDEGGSPSFINPQEIHDALVAAKNNEPNNVVFLGIAADEVCFTYGYFATPAPRMQELADIFALDGRGVFYDLCSGNVVPAFDMAIDLVDSACDNFVPEG